jgi:putative DNA primase/helicase
MQYDVTKIPTELHHIKQWVCWKKLPLENGKVTKKPINPITNDNASVSNPNTWTDMMGAIIGAEQYGLDGIGFVLENGYFGVDLDDCTEELKVEFINQLQSYTEISQSGKGIHIICKGEIPKSARTKGVEIYKGGRFFVMTGNAINDYQIEDCTERIKPLYEKYILETKPKVEQPTQSIIQQSIQLTDQDLIYKANNSRNGQQFRMLFDGNWEALNYPSQSEADMAFCNLLAFWSGKNENQMDRLVRMSGLFREKWDRRQSGSTYGAITIKNAISNCRNVYSKQYEDETQILVNAKTGEVVVKDDKNYELTDTGNAQRFVDKYGGFVKYNKDNGQWVVWNGKWWQVDVMGKIKVFADILLTEMKLDAQHIDDEKLRKETLGNIKRASQHTGKEHFLNEAQHLDNVPVLNHDFDKQDFLLNTLSGVVDLQKGEVKPHNKEYLMSKIVPYEVDMNNDPKLWLSFLEQIFQGDKELIHYMQKALGYTLTGSIREQCLFLCYGEGSNGKSVLLDLVSRLLGDYSMNAQVETLLERKFGTGNYTSDLARLKGARFTTTGENNEGSKINEGLIKQLTGGERITARFLYGREFEFYPNFKIWLATNHKPIIRGNDNGIWRRIVSIPFLYKVPEQQRDKDLVFKLQDEIPQILGWAIKGCLMWQKEGLKLPSTIEKSNKEYQNEMDIIATFIEDNAELISGETTSAKELYEEYEKWAKTSNEWIMSSTRFGRDMAKRFEKIRKSYGWVYVGIRLNKNSPTYVYNENDK